MTLTVERMCSFAVAVERPLWSSAHGPRISRWRWRGRSGPRPTASGFRGGGGERMTRIAVASSRNSGSAVERDGSGSQISRWRWRGPPWSVPWPPGFRGGGGEASDDCDSELQNFAVAVERPQTNAIPSSRISRWRWRGFSTASGMLAYLCVRCQQPAP